MDVCLNTCLPEVVFSVVKSFLAMWISKDVARLFTINQTRSEPLQPHSIWPFYFLLKKLKGVAAGIFLGFSLYKIADSGKWRE